MTARSQAARSGTARIVRAALALASVPALLLGCAAQQTNTAPTFPELSITTTELPQAVLNATYAGLVRATGGDLSYDWSLIDGTLPQGLSLGAGSGAITGVPTELGASTFMLQVTSGDGQSATVQLSILVIAAAPGLRP